MKQSKVVCGCGCGKLVYPNQLTAVEIEQASDEAGRRTRVRRVYVTRACKEPYEEEQGLLKCLQVIVVAHRWRAKSFRQKLNVFRTLDDYWMRIGAAIKVMRLNHAIYERPKGFDWARRHAIRSALLMGCPRFMQGWLSRRYLRKVRSEALSASREADATQEIATEET